MERAVRCRIRSNSYVSIIKRSIFCGYFVRLMIVIAIILFSLGET